MACKQDGKVYSRSAVWAAMWVSVYIVLFLSNSFYSSHMEAIIYTLCDWNKSEHQQLLLDFVLDGSEDLAKYTDLRNWSCAAGYGVGSQSPLSPSFNIGIELARSSQVILLKSV